MQDSQDKPLTPPAPAPGPQDPAVDYLKRVEEEGIEQLRQSASFAQDKDPAKWGQTLQLSRKTNLSPDFVYRNFDRLKVLNRPELSMESIEPNSKTASWLRDPQNMALMSPKMFSEMQRFERRFQRLKGALQTIPDADLKVMAREMMERKYRKANLAGRPTFINPAYELIPAPFLEGMKQLDYDGILDTLRKNEQFIGYDDPIEYGEQVVETARKNPLFWAPFFSSVSEFLNEANVYSAAKAVEGGYGSKADEALLITTGRYAMASELRGMSGLGELAGIITGLPSFAMELAWTGGVSEGVRGALKETAEQAVKGLLTRTIKKAITNRFSRLGLGYAAQTIVARPLHILKDAIGRMTPDGQATILENGDRAYKVKPGSGEPFWVAFPKGFVEEFNQVASEHLSDLPFMKKMDEGINRVLFGWWMKKNPGKFGKEFSEFMEKAHFGSIPSEMAEEELNKFMDEIGFIRPYELPTLQTLGAEALGFAIPGLVQGGLSHLGQPVKAANPNAFRIFGEIAADSELIKNMPRPEALKYFRDLAEGSGMERVYVDPQAVADYAAKKGLNPGQYMDQVMGSGGGTALEEARAHGVKLGIPFENYAVMIAPTEHNTFFENELSTSPDEMSPREAKEMIAEEAGRTEEEQAKVNEKLKGMLQRRFIMEENIRQLSTEVALKFRQAGRVRENEVLGKIWGERYATRAERRGFGETPLDLYRERPLVVHQGKTGTTEPAKEGEFEEKVETDFIKNDEGKPKSFYYPSTRKTESFSGPRIFFEDPVQAQDEASMKNASGRGDSFRDRTGGGAITAANIRIARPLNAKTAEGLAKLREITGKEADYEMADAIIKNKEVRAKLKEAGYDGVEMNYFDSPALITLSGKQAEVDQEEDVHFYERYAYNASRARFARFIETYIGTGEGVDKGKNYVGMFGWGFYFTETMKVAEYYRDILAGRFMHTGLRAFEPATQMGQAKIARITRRYKGQDAEGLFSKISSAMHQAGYEKSHVMARLKSMIRSLQDQEDFPNMTEQWIRHIEKDIATVEEIMAMIESGDLKIVESKGTIYKVTIPNDDEYMLWDSHLVSQSDKVKAALESDPVTRDALKALYSVPSKDELSDPVGYELSEGIVLMTVDNFTNKQGGETIASYEKELRENSGWSEDVIKDQISMLKTADYVIMDQVSGAIIHSITTGELPNYFHRAFTRGENLYNILTNHFAEEAARKGVPAEKLASKHLASIGIKGTKYLDERSRDSDVLDKSYNFVVYDQDLIDIIEFYEPTEGGPGVPIPTGGGGANIRGKTSIIRVGDHQKIDMTVYQNATVKTAIHESWHVWLVELAEDAKAFKNNKESPQQLRDDLDIALKHMGAKSRSTDDLDTIIKEISENKGALSEKFVAAAEVYLKEGKAPSQELAGVFWRFFQWLKGLLKAVTAEGVRLSPELRGVFDRMLATDAQIDAVSAETGVQGEFLPELSDSGMTPKQIEQYRKVREANREKAKQVFLQRIMKNIAQQDKVWYKEAFEDNKKLAEEQVSQEPVYKILNNMQHGLDPFGVPLPPIVPQVKLMESDVLKNHGKTVVGLLKEMKPGVLVKDKDPLGHTVKFAADFHGIGSADELIDMLVQSKPKEEKVYQLAKQMTEADYGEQLTDEQLREEGLKALHNTELGKLFRMELQMLASGNLNIFKNLVRAAALKLPSIEDAQREAADYVTRQKIRDIMPELHQQAVRKAHKDSVEGVLKGDVDQAVEAKRRQVINHELYVASVDGKDEVDDILAYVQRFNKIKTRDRLAESGESYIEQVDGIMERFEFRNISEAKQERRQSLREFVESERAEDREPIIPEKLLNEAFKTNYKDLTLGDLRQIRDTLKNIEKLSKLKNKLMKSQDQREFNAVRDEATAAIKANQVGPDKNQAISVQGPIIKLFRAGAAFLAMHRRFDSIIRQMDGFKDGGILWKIFSRPKNEAADDEATRTIRAAKALKKLFSKYSVAELTGLYLPKYYKEIGRKMSKAELLIVALNWGNEVNRQRMMDGEGWNENQIKVLLDGLTGKDWDIIEGVWDHFEGYWPDVKALAERVDGVAPEKIEAKEFEVTTKEGVSRKIKGGYFPLRYDARRSQLVKILDVKDHVERAMRGAAIRSMTKHGYREERAEKVTLPILFDLGVIFQHVEEVIHDLTHYEYLVDANRLLRDTKVSNAIKKAHGDLMYTELETTLKDIAGGRSSAHDQLERALAFFRRGTTVAVLAWKVKTAIMQALGILQGIVRVGPINMAKGLFRFIGDAARMENTVKWIMENSPFMRNRPQTMDREINEVRGTLRLRGKLGWVEDTYFYLLSKFQMVADVMTYLGQFEKSIDDLKPDQAKTEDERKAIEETAHRLSDQAVRDTQGSGMVGDLARMFRGGPYRKLFTLFGTFFNTTYNLTSESWKRTNFKNPLQFGRFLVDMMLLYAMPPYLTMLIGQALTGGGGDDDERETAEEYFAQLAAYAANSMVLTRELASPFLGYEYKGPAALKFLEEGVGMTKQTMDAFKEGGEFDAGFWHQLNDVGGILFQYPSGQINQMLRGLESYQEGRSGPGSVLVGPKPSRR